MCKDPRGTVEPSVCCACEGHPGFGRSERIKKFKASLQPLQYDTVSDVVESKVQFASKILTPNRMD